MFVSYVYFLKKITPPNSAPPKKGLMQVIVFASDCAQTGVQYIRRGLRRVLYQTAAATRKTKRVAFM
jgi:hypothetical protein